MRGELVLDLEPDAAERITPAYAGRTEPPPPNMEAMWDHPRVCGENLPPQIANMLVQGSPPRMRGEQNRGVSGY